LVAPALPRTLPATPTTELPPPSLHAALPICKLGVSSPQDLYRATRPFHFLPHIGPFQRDHRATHLDKRQKVFRQYPQLRHGPCQDRKSTRLNSSHVKTSYAVFGLKKKKHPTC